MAKTVAAALLCIVFALAPTAIAQPAPLRVLFVGNNLTCFNDLPATFAAVQVAAQWRALRSAVRPRAHAPPMRSSPCRKPR